MLEEQFVKRDIALRISNIPRDIKSALSTCIVDAKFPRQGNGHIDTPVIIANTALEKLSRRIDGVKGGFCRQTASAIINGITRNPDELI